MLGDCTRLLYSVTLYLLVGQLGPVVVMGQTNLFTASCQMGCIIDCFCARRGVLLIVYDRKIFYVNNLCIDG